MSATATIERLSEIASGYDALACDAWGVIHNGKTLLPGAADAMIRFRDERGPVVILTNAPKPSSAIPAQLDRLGLPREAWDAIVTSGDVTRAEIEARAGAPAYRIGPSFDDPLFEGVDVSFVSELADASFIVCTGLNDGFTEEPESYRALLSSAARRGLTMVCANPDIQVNWGGRLMWCAGVLAEIFMEYGGEVVFAGKPHAPAYRLVAEKIANARGGDDARILAVGDGLKTDILGANNAGFDAVLVAGAGGLLEGQASLEDVAAKLKALDLKVRAIMTGLRW
jgi:HAD superfamily hydrolase (TIGR01459 family)